jgi:hypothetical protein
VTRCGHRVWRAWRSRGLHHPALALVRAGQARAVVLDHTRTPLLGEERIRGRRAVRCHLPADSRHTDLGRTLRGSRLLSRPRSERSRASRPWPARCLSVVLYALKRRVFRCRTLRTGCRVASGHLVAPRVHRRQPKKILNARGFLWTGAATVPSRALRGGAIRSAGARRQQRSRAFRRLGRSSYHTSVMRDVLDMRL